MGSKVEFMFRSLFLTLLLVLLSPDSFAQDKAKPHRTKEHSAKHKTKPTTTTNVILPEDLEKIKVNPKGKIEITLVGVMATTQEYTIDQCRSSFPDKLVVGVSQSVYKLGKKNSILITHRNNKIMGSAISIEGSGNWKGEREGPFHYYVTGLKNPKTFYGMSVDNKCVMFFTATPLGDTLIMKESQETPVHQKTLDSLEKVASVAKKIASKE